MNKTMAGYHILMILSAIDFRFDARADNIIRSYLLQEFPFHVSLDREMAIISNLKYTEWENHFLKAIDDFYEDSTYPERINLINFAQQLCQADDVITSSENYYLNLLYKSWSNKDKDIIV